MGAVHPTSGRVDAMTRTLLVAEDPDYGVMGGTRTGFAFSTARLHECVAVCKKLKPERQGAVKVGWTSVFSPPLTSKDPPTFLRCIGKTNVKLSSDRHDSAKPAADRQRPAASVFSDPRQ